jgi:hypothetical protein
MSQWYFCQPWLLESCIAYQWFFHMYPPPPFSFWNITVLWSNNTQIVSCNRITMSLSICSMVQRYIAREWKYNTNQGYKLYLHKRKLPLSVKNWRKYRPDLKSDCNNGGKLAVVQSLFFNWINVYTCLDNKQFDRS